MDCPITISKYAGLYYIKQLRPLSLDDFKMVNPAKTGNALDFINDDVWDIDCSPFEEVKGSLFALGKTITFEAYSLVEFKWKDHIEKQLKEIEANLKSEVEKRLCNFEHVEDCLKYVNQFNKTTIKHTFTWRGCGTDYSKERKYKKERKLFLEKFESTKEERIIAKKNYFIKKLIEMIDKSEHKFGQEFVCNIEKNVPHYSKQVGVDEREDFVALENKANTLKEKIEELKKQMKPLQRSLSEIYDFQFDMRLQGIRNYISEDKDVNKFTFKKVDEKLSEVQSKGRPKNTFFERY